MRAPQGTGSDPRGENVNTNSTPEPPQQQTSPDPPARNDGGGSSGPTTRQNGRLSTGSVGGTFTVYFLLLVRDLLTFLTRGGLSAMMFAMDQTLRAFLLVLEFLLGPTASAVVGYPGRMAMWLYQLLLWITYILVELLFYLPWPVLLAYVALLTVVLVVMPSPVLTFLLGLFKTLHNFIGVYKILYRFVGGSEKTASQS